MRILDEIQIFINIYILLSKFVDIIPLENLTKQPFQISYLILIHNITLSSILFFIYGFYTGFQFEKKIRIAWKSVQNNQDFLY